MEMFGFLSVFLSLTHVHTHTPSLRLPSPYFIFNKKLNYFLFVGLVVGQSLNYLIFICFRENVRKLSQSNRVNGIIVISINLTDQEPFSADKSCPNDASGKF